MASISLVELQKIIKQSIDALPDTYWVVAEINELKISGAGHCFLELVQRKENKEQLEAKANANIWASVYRALCPYFEASAGRPFAEGMSVLLRVAVQYHELYGLSLNVIDVDPAYTVGEMEMQRQKTLARLQSEGVLEMNKELPFPPLPQRIAVVSSEQAAGYGDFMHQLHGNSSGYKFVTTLFSASMQGNQAEQTMIAALEEIHCQAQNFDVVAILRGGGSQSDLSCFDSYELASHIAQFSLPVITGIGHDKDMSVADCVAHTMLKTPTATAEFLISQFEIQEQYLNQLQTQIIAEWAKKVETCKAQLQQNSLRITLNVSRLCSLQRQKISIHLPQRLHSGLLRNIKNEKSKIQQLQTKIHLLDPQNILQRGYSITLHNGKPLQDAQQVRQGDVLKTLLSKGKITSIVN